MKYIFYVLFVCTSSLCIAQNKTQDSIFNALKTHSIQDSIRVSLLVSAGNHITYSNPNQAFKLVEDATEISTKINWTKGLVLSKRLEGVIYYSLSDKLNAMEAFQEALKISYSIPHNELIEASIYSNLGNIYADLESYDKALSNYNAYLSITKKLNNKNEEIIALVNIGTVQIEIEDFDNGIMNLERALILAKEEKNDFYIAAILNNIGLAYKSKKEYTTALHYYQEAFNYATQAKSKYTQATALNSLGKISLILEDYDLAKTYSEKGLQLAKETNAVEWQADAFETLSKIHEHNNNYTDALIAYKNHIKLRDSVYAEEKVAELTRKEMQFKIDKQKTIANAEISRQKLLKNSTLIGGSGLALASVIGFVLYRRKRDAVLQKKEATFNLKVADTELKALRAQMNPHFIFNSLNSINDFISKNDTESASNYLIKFSKLMRETLEKSSENEILLADDIQILKTYMDIENKRTQHHFSYTFNVDDAIDPENTLVPPMILQPFIENSIIHGFSNHTPNGHIKINFRKQNDMLICTVSDNGIGRKKSSEIQGSKNRQSLGVSITKNRLDIINKKKNAKGHLKIYDNTQGTSVEIALPLTLAY